MITIRVQLGFRTLSGVWEQLFDWFKDCNIRRLSFLNEQNFEKGDAKQEKSNLNGGESGVSVRCV